MSSTPSTPPGVPPLLDGRYRVGELIARGGMASVLRGHDERLDRVVALKIMHPHLAEDAEFRRRFAREARAAARLAHRHVVGVFDQGEDGDRIYLSMELVEGRTLRSRLRADGPPSVRESLEITAQVLEALVAAHGAGIVHRDIKPENILLDVHGSVKVADFGLARAIGAASSSASATLLGTVAYVSPEVVTRGHCDERSDLYSLGIVLFELLTGRQPFTGEQPVHIAFQHVHDDIPAPSSGASGVPAELDSLVTWAAARPVAQRPASASELLRAVRELLATLPAGVLAARPEPIEPAETAHTGEVPRATAHLDDAAAAVDVAPRRFAPSARGGTEEADGRADDQHEGIDHLRLRPPRPRRGRHARGHEADRSQPVVTFAAVLLAALVLTGGWSAFAWYSDIGPGADRTIPVLSGTELADAESALDGQDLSVTTDEEFSDDVPAGHVIAQDPEPGAVVKKGAGVHLVVSRGEELFTVPVVEGRSLDEAREEVEGVGLELVELDPAYSETVPAGSVISQSAGADALPAGGEVSVVVSQGREPITVPDQVGRTGDAARETLEEAGFTVATSEEHSGSVPAGSVISQSPASGSGYRGDTVTIVVSQGPEMLPVPDVFRMTENEARTELEDAGFDVEVEHERGESVFGLVYEQSAEAGSRLERGATVTITVF